MDKNEIYIKIREIMNSILDDDKKVPETFNANIVDKLDSIEFVMLIIEIETQFGIKIDDDDIEIENVGSFENLADLVEEYINK